MLLNEHRTPALPAWKNSLPFVCWVITVPRPTPVPVRRSQSIAASLPGPLMPAERIQKVTVHWV